jgi:dGTP triphosphohydrolase
VARIKENVLGTAAAEGNLRTIECAIMDAADDIAYATYDLEDSLKGGFMSPMDMLACNHKLAKRVRNKIRNDPEAIELLRIKTAEVRDVLRELALEGLAHVSGTLFPSHPPAHLNLTDSISPLLQSNQQEPRS